MAGMSHNIVPSLICAIVGLIVAVVGRDKPPAQLLGGYAFLAGTLVLLSRL
jgi:hypothetical protein